MQHALETKNWDMVDDFIEISHTRPVLTVSDIELILKKHSKTLITGFVTLLPVAPVSFRRSRIRLMACQHACQNPFFGFAAPKHGRIGPP
jgi:hypothetical protein